MVAFVGFKIGRKTIAEDIIGAYTVAGDQSHPFSALHQILRCGVAAILGYVGVTPERLAPDLPQKVEKVGVEVEEELVAPFVAVHAMNASQPGFADFAPLYEGNGDVLDGGDGRARGRRQ